MLSVLKCLQPKQTVARMRAGEARESDACAKNVGSATGRDGECRHSENVLESRMLFRRQGGKREEKEEVFPLSLELTFAWQALYVKNQIVRLAGP